MSHTLLFGGTFDPIHHGHLITCQRAMDLLGADRVIFIPARVSPHKTETSPSTPGEHRLAMIRLAIANRTNFAVDMRELIRAGPSYTIDTVEEMRREYPAERFTLLIGADQLPKLHTWVRIKDLLAMGSDADARALGIAVLARILGSSDRAEIQAGLGTVGANLGQAVAERLGKAILPTPLIEISATTIRQRAHDGKSIDFLVPSAVAAYIREHNLYRSL